MFEVWTCGMIFLINDWNKYCLFDTLKFDCNNSCMYIIHIYIYIWKRIGKEHLTIHKNSGPQHQDYKSPQ